MAGSAPNKGIVRLAKTTGQLVGAWVVALGATWPRRNAVHDWLADALFRIFAGFPALADTAQRVLDKTMDAGAGTYVVALFFASLGVPLGFVARMVARARVRAGHADPLDRARAWTNARPRATAAIVGIPALLWTVLVARWLHWGPENRVVIDVAIAAASGLVQWSLLRAGLRLLLEPTIDEGAVSTMTISDDEIVFDAVAVTRETIGAIVVMALMPIAFVAWVTSIKLAKLYTDRTVFEVFLAYVALALGGAFAFKQGSRTAVGIDGVRVYGTSRTRFFAYRDLDEARFRGDDLELVRNGKVLLRLQLHGEDASRREAVLTRINDHVARARDTKLRGAQRFVEAKSTEEVARVAMGGGDYRAPSITRDALWQLVEGPTTDAASRAAAAEALVRTIGEDERPRLRVAAEKCADVRMRVALERIADALPIQDTAPAPPRRPQRA